jgi:hypothetical protein
VLPSSGVYLLRKARSKSQSNSITLGPARAYASRGVALGDSRHRDSKFCPGDKTAHLQFNELRRELPHDRLRKQILSIFALRKETRGKPKRVEPKAKRNRFGACTDSPGYQRWTAKVDTEEDKKSAQRNDPDPIKPVHHEPGRSNRGPSLSTFPLCVLLVRVSACRQSALRACLKITSYSQLKAAARLHSKKVINKFVSDDQILQALAPFDHSFKDPVCPFFKSPIRLKPKGGDLRVKSYLLGRSGHISCQDQIVLLIKGQESSFAKKRAWLIVHLVKLADLWILDFRLPSVSFACVFKNHILQPT